jgi:hypothetical protein
MFSISDKIKIIGTNSHLEERVVSLLLFGVFSIKYGQEQANIHSNFREKSFIKLAKFLLEF